ncbi:aspartate/glutamate racemase family protein [Niveibacterium sp. SC-1]|uniref:aspartate/glutamate racemase family protein n=1 Tax=Niveibacterium sp. SC-1 TaxID=3135646 RepID=UPI00311EC99B
MPRLLILNPNTSESVTAVLAGHARRQLGAAWDVVARTARFGAEYIASEAAYAIAGHAVLDAWAAEPEGADVVLIGCFGDPGLHALQELCPVPVVGLAEAAMREAAGAGRFSIVTGGARWRPMLKRLAAGLELPLVEVHTLTESGPQLAADPEAALVRLADTCRTAGQADQSESVILGGAALAGYGDQLVARSGLKVIDSVSAGLRACAAAHSPAAAPGPDGVAYRAIAPELIARLRA